ncbi:CaiB/BaiF CoA transferase family protein [Cryptosporangium aurantiacum]|uniref:Crotonobetainyl-CoA:carnitine CoA-transferase CaiB n=1 Tax=Cryptosporangium aurantiacum TaxID=134849 RepID=A0A1M7R3U2_9ACTN|nr:CaiB/BaiF CoA-transferase family protein [Cryptosporangium aurantiacum]SHN39601.1 Crotonobetainyl-CoA:carnitine CoA-transferase CaiB [Cryptosporangium aurantiacum]
MHTLPLAGIRILEFGGYIAVPYAGSILGSLGADVIKIERPDTGDEFRRRQDDQSLYFRQYNAGKRSLAVDLKAPAGADLVCRLLPTVDIVIENFRPGKMDRLGLGREHCVAVRPDLLYMSVTGFGESGPMALRPAYDMIGQAFGGLLATLSDRDAAQLTGTCLADLVTGLSCATGILAGLVGRAASGSAPRIDTSITEAISTLTIDAMTQLFDSGSAPHRQSRHPQAQNFCLKTSTGDFVTLHLSSSQKFWESLIDTVGRPELLTDERFATYPDRVRNYADLAKILEGEFLLRPFDAWETALIERDVPFAPVLDVADYRDHPQVEALGVIAPEVDGLALVRVPWRFDGGRPDRAPRTPRVGEHSLDVAAEVCDDAELRELTAAGVLFSPATR